MPDAHAGCRCDEDSVDREGRRFCSDSCANAEKTGPHEEVCLCGHPDCRQ